MSQVMNMGVHSATRACVTAGAPRLAAKILPRSQVRPQILAALIPLLSACNLLSGCNRSAPAFTEPMTLGGREVAPEVLNQGHDLYIRHCVSCHGDTGAGDGPAARHMKFPPRDFRTGEFSFAEAGALPSHEALVERIQVGVPERGMPSWKGMRAEDLAALANYIKTFSPRWAAPSS
jgi:mono/diheme cytochrome c family protein